LEYHGIDRLLLSIHLRSRGSGNLGWFDRAGGQNNAEKGINDLLIHDHLHYTFASLEKREINLA
jgi:hypothetical protein